MSKQFLQKPRYEYCEDKKYIVDTELDVLVDIDGVIDRLNTQCFQKKELLRNIQIKDEQILNLQHKLKVAEMVTKLACDELRALNYKTFNNADIDFEQLFKEQAEKEIKGE